MIQTIIAIVLVAVLFVVYTLVGHHGCTGHCAGCTGSCGRHDEGDPDVH